MTLTRPLSVLVVEDMPDGAESTAMLLSLENHEVHVALNATQALETVRKYPPDVVLLDIGLPDMSGYELAARIREIMPKQPVIAAVTGYGQPKDFERSWSEGFDEHFIKPVDPYALSDYLMECASKLLK